MGVDLMMYRVRVGSFSIRGTFQANGNAVSSCMDIPTTSTASPLSKTVVQILSVAIILMTCSLSAPPQDIAKKGHCKNSGNFIRCLAPHGFEYKRSPGEPPYSCQLTNLCCRCNTTTCEDILSGILLLKKFGIQDQVLRHPYAFSPLHIYMYDPEGNHLKMALVMLPIFPPDMPCITGERASCVICQWFEPFNINGMRRKTVYLNMLDLIYPDTYKQLQISGIELNPGPNNCQGYKVNLKDPDAELPSHLLCVKCNLLLRKPRQTVCGHRLCSGCLQEHVSNGHRKCVVNDCEDIIPSEDQVYPDRAVEREVLRLEVVCTNKGDGCPWEGKLKDYEAHETDCEFIRQPCGRSGCKDFVYKKDLERHLKEDCLMRPVDCEYCNAQLVFKDIQDHHLSDCPEFPVECDQCHIDKTFTRSQLKNHQDLVSGDCPVKLAPCTFASFGCTKKVKPEETDGHVRGNLKEHLQLLFLKTEEVRRQQAEVNVRHQNGEADHQCGELEGKLEALQGTLNDLNSQIIRAERGQEQRPTPGQSQEVNEVRAMMDERERKLQRCEEAIIDLARKLEVLFQQIDFYERERHKNQEMLQAGANKITMLERSLASKDDTLQLNDTRVENLERATYNGILVWKITDFLRRRQDAVNNRVPSFYSPPFYTSKSGYKMCARIYLNGDGMGKGTHVSLFFVICKGSNDALLRWPFRQKVTLMLLDQNNKEHIIDAFRPDPSSSSFKKPTNEMNIASGCPMFATLSQLDSPSHAYIKDDTVFFKIIVDCADLQ